MTRWTIGWLMLIMTATAGVHAGTNAFISAHPLTDKTLAFQPLGELGSSACTGATRRLVAAGAGASADATFDQRAAYERAALEVQRACSAA